MTQSSVFLYVNGNKKCTYIQFEDYISSVVYLGSVLITTAIKAIEGWDVAVTKLPGAYFITYVAKEVHIVLKLKLAKLMEITTTKIYCKYITYDKKINAIIYIHLVKVLYGCPYSALFLYHKLWGDIH